MNRYSTLKFFFKCILATLPLLILTGYTALFPFAYMDAEYPSWAYTKSICHSPSFVQPDVLILGDSRAMADINPNELETNVENLAVGGATAIEMYYTLSDYLSKHPAPSTVFIMFAPFHYSYMDNFWERTVYFNYLTPIELSDVFSNARRMSSETVLKDNYLFESLSYRLRLPDKYLPALLNSRLFLRYDANTSMYQSLCENHGHGLFGKADGSTDLNYEVNYTQMNPSGDARLISFYFDRLLALCEDKQIQVIVEQPPMNEASFGLLQSSYLAEYTLYMEDYQSKYPTFTINSDIPCYENSFFGDSSHLNSAGADVYTESLKKNYPGFFQ